MVRHHHFHNKQTERSLSCQKKWKAHRPWGLIGFKTAIACSTTIHVSQSDGLCKDVFKLIMSRHHHHREYKTGAEITYNFRFCLGKPSRQHEPKPGFEAASNTFFARRQCIFCGSDNPSVCVQCSDTHVSLRTRSRTRTCSLPWL